jgi:hypothetical protein
LQFQSLVSLARQTKRTASPEKRVALGYFYGYGERVGNKRDLMCDHVAEDLYLTTLERIDIAGDGGQSIPNAVQDFFFGGFAAGSYAYRPHKLEECVSRKCLHLAGGADMQGEVVIGVSIQKHGHDVIKRREIGGRFHDK